MLQEQAGKYIKVEESLRKTVPTSEGSGKKRKGDLDYGPPRQVSKIIEGL